MTYCFICFHNCIVQVVGNPPQTSTWHTTSIRVPSIWPPHNGDMWHTSFIWVPPGGHTALSHILLERCSPLSGCVARISGRKTQAMLSHLRQPVTARIPPPAERKNRNDGKSPPTIFDSRLQNDDDSAITSGTSWQAKKSSHH